MHYLYIPTPEGTHDDLKAAPLRPLPFALPGRPMTPDAFTASLERSAVQHPPSRTRRIAALLPQIEAAKAQGSPRAHIVTALLNVGIDITPHQLSNAISRLRRQRVDSAGLPEAGPAVVPAGVPKGHALSLAAVSTVARIASVPALAPASVACPAQTPPASKYGAHDPRLLDEVMRSTPDMKALAKLAPKHPNQGKS